MKMIARIVLLCFIGLFSGVAQSAPPETLKLSDLANRPDRWPASVTLARDFNFVGGATARKGQPASVKEFDGSEVAVTSGDLNFTLAPNQCDFLQAANKIWAALSPVQRAVEPATLSKDVSLWPTQVKFVSEVALQGAVIQMGDRATVLAVTPDKVSVYLPKINSTFKADFAQTDLFAQARQNVLLERSKRPSRVVDGLKGALVNTKGERYTNPKLDEAQIFALYYGASWCGPCRQFTPGFIAFVNRVAAKNPRLTVAMMSNDEDPAKMLGYMQEEKMPWPALPLATLNKSPLLRGFPGNTIPKLVIVDRFGKVLANSAEIGRDQTVQKLQALLDSGAAQ